MKWLFLSMVADFVKGEADLFLNLQLKFVLPVGSIIMLVLKLGAGGTSFVQLR